VINANPYTLLGFKCHYLNKEHTLAAIDTPFVFEDKDPLPVYIEEVGQEVRVFDDGGVVSHFDSIGIPWNNSWAHTKFIEDVARQHGVTLNDQGEVEIWADTKTVPEAFARYLAALLEMVCWEREFNLTGEKRRQEYLATGTATSTLENFLHGRPA
jgi:hypothetical protein